MTIPFPKDRPLDAICLGRAGMDLYAKQENTDFTSVEGFHKHVGGSPANIAIGMCKLGAKVGFIGVVSGDVVGEYVTHNLKAHGVDTSQIRTDQSGTRTSLALTEMRPDNCQVVIYRNQAADLALSADDIDGTAIFYIAGFT